jgi:hypothetical protein
MTAPDPVSVTKAEVAESAAYIVEHNTAWLREHIQMGAIVYMNERGRNLRTGQVRFVSVHIVFGHRIVDITARVALALELRAETRNGSSCLKYRWDGLDAGVQLVGRLSRQIWPDGEAHPFISREWI